MVEQPLFGGAITCEIPVEWRDVSDVRQVPDHQECWQDLEGRVLVVEILEHQASVANEAAASFFFQDLADCNGCSSADIQPLRPLSPPAASPPSSLALFASSQTQPRLPNSAVLCCGEGYQRVGKDRSGNVGKRWIHVELGAIRLPQVGTDLVVTLSTPRENQENTDVNNTTPASTDLFRRILASVNVRDWGLFGA